MSSAGRQVIEYIDFVERLGVQARGTDLAVRDRPPGAVAVQRTAARRALESPQVQEMVDAMMDYVRSEVRP